MRLSWIICAVAVWAGNASAQQIPTPVTVTAPEALGLAKIIVDAYQLPCAAAQTVDVYGVTRLALSCTSGEKYALLLEGSSAYAVPWVSREHLFSLRMDNVAAAAAATRADAALSGSTPTNATPSPLPPALPARQASAAELASLAGRSKGILDSLLLDYPSARFRDVRAVWTYARQQGQAVGSPWLAFCGQVNTKNRAGAYGGWTTFYVSPDAPDGRTFGLAGDRRGVGGILAYANCEANQLERASDRDFAPAVQP